MIIINEVQGQSGYVQDLPIETIQKLVEIGVLFHVHTSLVNGTHIYRYFVPEVDKHDYSIHCNDRKYKSLYEPKVLEQIK